MSATNPAPARPGVIDRIRDLIAKLFGRPPQGAPVPVPAAAPGVGRPFVGRPGDPAQLAIVSCRGVAAA